MTQYAASEIADVLQTTPATLRKWSREFGTWLTAEAVNGQQYAEDDLRVLRYAANLIKQRRNYSRVRTALAAEFMPIERERVVGETTVDTPLEEPQPAADEDEVLDAEVIEPEPFVAPDIAALLERLADLYRELLRDKEQEIAALRQALDAIELSAANERRELETLHRLSGMLDRENQRLQAELADTREQAGLRTTREGFFARFARRLGLIDDSSISAPAAHD